MLHLISGMDAGRSCAMPRRLRLLHDVTLEQEKEEEAIVKETLRPAVLDACMIQKDHQVEEDHRTIIRNNCQDNETKQKQNNTT